MSIRDTGAPVRRTTRNTPYPSSPCPYTNTERDRSRHPYQHNNSWHPPRGRRHSPLPICPPMLRLSSHSLTRKQPHPHTHSTPLHPPTHLALCLACAAPIASLLPLPPPPVAPPPKLPAAISTHPRTQTTAPADAGAASARARSTVTSEPVPRGRGRWYDSTFSLNFPYEYVVLSLW